ncbi:MAG: hypothetical protein ABIT05_05770 [Chitinophagaceae bacterium]
MFGLFKKKEPGIVVTDKIVIGKSARLNALHAAWVNDPETVFIFWFDESLETAAAWFTAQGSMAPLLTARETTISQLAGKTVVFAEHYPVRSKEEDLYRKLNLTAVTVYSSLEDPLFKRFGSDKIIQLMRQLGMNEEEVIEHKMITKSIRDAQEKIEKKLLVEQTARSQESWLEINLPG